MTFQHSPNTARPSRAKPHPARVSLEAGKLCKGRIYLKTTANES